MSAKLDLLTDKIQKVVDELRTLRKENLRLRSDCESLKSQIALSSGESRKVQRVLAEYDQLKRNQEQAAARVGRALQKLTALRFS